MRTWLRCYDTSLSLLLLRSNTHSISACLFTIYDFIFSPLYTHAFLSSAAFDLNVQKCFLKRSSFVPPQSHLFFFFPLSTVFRGVEASNSVTFLCRLCVCLCRVCLCVSTVCGPFANWQRNRLHNSLVTLQ